MNKMIDLMEECARACEDFQMYNESDTYLDAIEQKVWYAGKAMAEDRHRQNTSTTREDG